jgi:hypothetical protein
MDQTVNIPFSIRLEPGDSEFQIKVDKKFIDNPNRLFGFSTVTLTPDYYSRQAFQLDLDSEEELKGVINNDFNFEVEYDQNAFDKNPYTSGAIPRQTILKTINKHYEQHRLGGMYTPLIVFDWVHIGSLAPKVNKETYYKENVGLFYTELPEEEASDISDVFKPFVQLNNYPFPTKEDVLSNVRIRVTLAPNVTLAFSNTLLPLDMGFDETQLSLSKQQYRIQNPSSTSFKSVICFKKASLKSTAYSTKIHTYPTQKYVTSNGGILTTTKEKERKPALLVNDYNKGLIELAKTMNLEFSLVHDLPEKKIKLAYPAADGIRLNLRWPAYISHKLGYPLVSLIKPDMTNNPYQEELEINNVEAIAKVLVYDTGMVVVSLDQQASKQTYQFTNTVMAILESDDAGVMTTKPGLEFSRVPVSYFSPDLQFMLSRFNENNEPMPLGWKVGAYIRGVLVGKV